MQKEIEDAVSQLETMVAKKPTLIQIRNNTPRIGNFTSSEIVALTKQGKKEGTFGVPALTYIEETNMERRLQRSISDECSAHALVWGKFLESRVNELIGSEYSLCSSETIVHPSIPYWCGSPDGFKYDEGKTVIDDKCPLTLKSFCQLIDPLYHNLTGIDAINAIRNGFVDSNGLAHAAHKDGEKFYWQLVSNSVLSDSKFAELIVYMPYQSELPAIQLSALSVDRDQLQKHYWIANAAEGELPYLIDGGYYKNINIIRFEVPQADKDLLTSFVLRAGEMLIDNSATILATREPKLQATIIEGIKLIKILKTA